MHCNRFLILLILSLGCTASLAKPDPQRFLIGIPDNDQINTFYKALTLKAYRKLGIEVEFVKVGAERGLLLLNQGVTDADVIRFTVSKDRFANILPILPPISEGEFTLYCQAEETCNRTVVDTPKNHIVILKSSFENAKLLLPQYQFSAQMMTFESQKQIEQLVLQGKVQYAIVTRDHKYDHFYETLGFNAHTLGIASATHFIHKQHAHLAAPLSKAFSDLLADKPMQTPPVSSSDEGEVPSVSHLD